MKLTSSAFKEGEEIPRLYTCQGEDIHPPLEIHDVPPEAKSLALIMDDPDVPSYIRKDQMWVHWVVYNIDPQTKEFVLFGRNTAGKNEYMGPCPPDRRHRYFFKLYALDTRLDLQEGASKEQLLKAMEGHIITQCELMGTYVKY